MDSSVQGALLKFSAAVRAHKYIGNGRPLREGGLLRMRVLQPTDRTRLKAFLRRCSAESIRSRFFRPIKEFSDALLNQLLAAEGQRQIALVVTRGAGEDEEIVAEGRAVALPGQPQVGDVAFLVQDDLQRRGIASWLLQELVTLGCRAGFTHFSADVLTENRAMIALIRKIGRERTASVSYGVVHYEIPLVCDESWALPQAA